jgi:3-O-methylgallate 3,4-dioxygenase
MAKIVLGLATSHSPMLALDAEQWVKYAKADLQHTGLVYPPEGFSMTYEEGLAQVPAAIKEKPLTMEVFEDQVSRIQMAIAELAKTFAEANPDVTVIVSDDQDEWFFEDNMPKFSVFWGDSVPIIPRTIAVGRQEPDVAQAIADGYGDIRLDVPVNKELGRHIIEYMGHHDFDVSHFNYIKDSYGGSVGRRYPRKDGEFNVVRDTEPVNQGLPHGYAFVVKRIFENQALPIVPVFQNTCYPPNQPTVRRSYQFGEALKGAIDSWDSDLRVAVVASGGLSHFVVDEEMDWSVLNGLKDKDPEVLKAVPRERLWSAASETQNWITLGGLLHDTELNFEVVDYLPVYRTPAGTGGGWGFGRWV